MTLIRTSSGKQFESTTGESILDAAMRARVMVEHSCKVGRCATCLARVLKGESKLLYREEALTAQQSADGWILTCARTATGAQLELEVDELDAVLPPVRTYPCRIKSLDILGRDVMRVILRLPPAQKLQYLPGQYVDVIAPGGLRRSYSIANSSAGEDGIELHVRKVEGGMMSQYWFQHAAANDLLRLQGPRGTFFLRGAGGNHLVFLATGVGIAPIKSMLGALGTDPQAAPLSVSLYWGTRSSDDLYWQPDNGAWPVDYTPVLSRADAGWAGERGYVQQAALEKHADFSRTVVFACGSQDMISDSKRLFVEKGLDPKKFYYDAFVASDPKLGVPR